MEPDDNNLRLLQGRSRVDDELGEVQPRRVRWHQHGVGSSRFRGLGPELKTLGGLYRSARKRVKG